MTEQTRTTLVGRKLDFTRVRLVLLGERFSQQFVAESNETFFEPIPWTPVSQPVFALPDVRFELPVGKEAISWLRTAVSTVLMVVAVSVLAFLFLPSVYYHFFPAEPVAVVPETSGTPLGGDFVAGPQETIKESSYQPPVDDSLPTGDWIVIPRIGVRTELQDTPQPEEALATGVWMVPGYGTPRDHTKPIITAAHRYGWKWWWQSDYWKYHSFYLLPEIEPGDRVEIIADQRKWIYEVYAGEEGEDITDYQADLILYTCKFLNSPLRHFRYARLIDPTKDTQS